MPRKYTRRQPDPPPLDPAIVPGVTTVAESSPPVLYAPHLSALEEYGLWLKANQHITDPLPALPPAPRKAKK